MILIAKTVYPETADVTDMVFCRLVGIAVFLPENGLCVFCGSTHKDEA